MAILLDDGSWQIRGRRIGFPVRITDAAVACATYLVRADRARRLIGGTGLELVSVAGRTPLFLVFIDYKINDLRDYDEVGVALLARHRGRTGPYIHQLPVTQTFTMETGRALWGLPKWLGRAELDIAGRHADCHLAEDDRHVLSASLSTLPGRLPFTVPGSLTALAPRGDTVLHSGVRLRARGTRLGFGAARVVLGSGHPMADELRAIGLPRRPLVTTIVDHVAFDMDPATATPR
ncbi:acetoacetate decarboxylase family protein [Pseudonocardia acidicola]|uniref:Acetoacetate decarboxylase family protein n=1 Tax=Pseudonocardia acidicola TaxID=2724939 RepID=A0ABX1SJS1_9PSEU|nr:acetoacetate decarboxylase family protein [Pseudonocardia acidicola]